MVSNYWAQNARLKGIDLTAEEYNFFQLVRLLDGLQLGEEEALSYGFSGHNSPALKPNFVNGVDIKRSEEGVSVKVNANAFHLLGQQGPIPQVYSEQIARESQSGNTGAAAFIDIFNDKILRTLYDIKKKFSPLLFNGEKSDSQLFELFQSVSGIADGSRFEQKMPSVFPRFWRRYTNVFGNRRVSYSLLKQLLTKLLNVTVGIEPASGGWRELPESSQVKLDGATALDGSRSLGRRYWSHSNCITVFLTFSLLEEYSAFLPGGQKHNQVVALVAVLTDLVFDVKLELKLEARDAPKAKLGSQRLGFSSWLARERQVQSGSKGACLYLDRRQMLAAFDGGAV